MANREKLARKQQFVDLFESGGEGYFKGCKVTLFPNGEKGEIWISDGMHGVRITAGKGRAGLRVSVERFAGGAPLSMTGNTHPDYMPIPLQDCQEISITQYNHDERSQAFKAWYAMSGEVQDQAAYEVGRTAAKEGTELPTDKSRLNPDFLRGYLAQKGGVHDNE